MDGLVGFLESGEYGFVGRMPVRLHRPRPRCSSFLTCLPGRCAHGRSWELILGVDSGCVIYRVGDQCY